MNSFMVYTPPSPQKQVMYRLTQVINGPTKALLYEEDDQTIDDGYGTPAANTGINLLAIRHDHARILPDNVANGLTLNGDRRGNVLFCDGHAEYISRNDLHSQPIYDPLYQ